MAWNQNKTILVTLLGREKRVDHTVSFEVAEEGRDAFGKAFEYFIAACLNNNVVFRGFQEVQDVDTSDVVTLKALFDGTVDKINFILNQHGPELSRHSVKVTR